LSKLHAQLNTTIIYVTHDQVEAMTMGTQIVIMKEGVVNQVGAPMEIYDYPVNKFVGQFIGNPGMNFMPARIVAQNSRLYVDAADFRLLIPTSKQSYLQNKIDREVIIGIRPEHIEDIAFLDASYVTDTFKAVVEVVETLGAEVQLAVVSGKHNLVARVDPRTQAQYKKEIELAVNMDKIHVFDTTPPNIRIKTEAQ
jgi:multiple sugar transport system ATP-binding protein